MMSAVIQVFAVPPEALPGPAVSQKTWHGPDGQR